MPSIAEDAKTEAPSVHWSPEQAPVRETGRQKADCGDHSRKRQGSGDNKYQCFQEAWCDSKGRWSNI